MREQMAAAIGLGLGAAADRLLGDPRRLHPVAGFGRVATAVERLSYSDSVAAGAGHTAALTTATVALGRLVGRPGGLTRAATTAVCTWAVLGGRSLTREAGAIAAQLSAGDLPAARQQLTHLVGRDTSDLSSSEIVRAALESVAENSSDAVVAPLCWGAVAGPAGLLGYRAVNTLDAMIGHRNARYGRFGKVAARLDDVANWLPARIAVLLTAACAPVVGGSPVESLRAARRDGPKHPSPNAGPVEAAFAGALGIRLGGVNSYHGRSEDRGQLGTGPLPTVADLSRAARLADAVGVAAAVFSGVVSLLLARAGRRRASRTPRRCRRR